ncbi:hypothetical protein GCM10009839_21720 [Catenulispora yoronensis]|uniref:Uncharacterized protein n=1 Tax=Catenulispora yoronensis TaxID=450799 RepID=A0ABP5FCL0_9ACTN
MWNAVRRMVAVSGRGVVGTGWCLRVLRQGGDGGFAEGALGVVSGSRIVGAYRGGIGAAPGSHRDRTGTASGSHRARSGLRRPNGLTVGPGPGFSGGIESGSMIRRRAAGSDRARSDPIDEEE